MNATVTAGSLTREGRQQQGLEPVGLTLAPGRRRPERWAAARELAARRREQLPHSR